MIRGMSSRGGSLAVAAFAFASVGVLAAVDISISQKTVVVAVDGVERPVRIYGDKAFAALQAAHVTVGANDRVVVGESENGKSDPETLQDGDRVEVFRARAIEAEVGGKQKTILTTAQSVEELLQNDEADALSRSQVADSGLPLTGGTAIEVKDNTHDGAKEYSAGAALPAVEKDLSPLDEAVFTFSDGLQLEITRVSKTVEVKADKIGFETQEEQTEDLFEGEWRVTQKGDEGGTELRELVTRRGVDAPVRTVLHSESKEPQNEVVETGTMPPTKIALIEAGVDPAAPLEEVVGEDGLKEMRFIAEVGSITSEDEIKQIKDDAYGTGDDNGGEDRGDDGEEIPTGTYSGEDPKGIAQTLLEERGLSGDFKCLLNLWERESGWNPYAENPYSGAYGIPQALPGSKMASAGADWRTNPRTQIIWGLDYIAGRYGTPCDAWAFFQTHNSY